MKQLVEVIENIRSRVDRLHKHSLKETPTRTIVIDPLLEALGWDVRDPDEVQLEYPTVDGKSVDYALKINKKPILLVEAKAFDDPLTDVKAITQVVGYAANDGIVWCVLTNGLKWKVYRSVEKCPAPDKLMFEVSLGPGESEGMSSQQLADQMRRFSRDELARGTLDALGEKTFTDGKVRKALDAIMRDAPRPLLNMVRKATSDATLTPQRIKESIARVWAEGGTGSLVTPTSASPPSPASQGRSPARRAAARKAWRTRRVNGTRPEHDEHHHLVGKPKEAVELYRTIDRLCLSMEPGRVERRYLLKHINYICAEAIFCSVHIRQSGLRVWLRLKLSRLDDPPPFARDVTSVGHWGVGDLELAISSLSQLEQAGPLIRESFESCVT